MSEPAVTKINGHEVELFALNSDRAPADAKSTDWIVVKFDRFVDYDFKQQLLQKHIEVHDRIGDNTYLCKYTPEDLAPVANDDSVSHLALYPTAVVPMVGVGGAGTGTASPHATADGGQANGAKVPFVVGLHPNPSQTPEQVLETLRNHHGAEPLDERLMGNIIRVNIDPAVIPEVSKIDSVRTLTILEEPTLDSIRQRAIMQFSSTPASGAYKGDGEVVFIGDSGFDMGDANDVHPAFTGRVLATTTAGKGVVAADWKGHGTHVAGSILGSLPGEGVFNVQGTAPGAKLVSIALPFGQKPFPQTLGLLTQDVAPHGRPIIMNNSWGITWDWEQKPYNPGNAAMVDKVMFDDPNVCILFSAGNNGEKVLKGEKRQQIGGYAAAKNCITVGATYSDRPVDWNNVYNDTGTVHSTSEMASFSSTGPTTNGRVKPDVVAPGAVILSARSRTILPDSLTLSLVGYGNPKSDDLLFMEGTSQATPAVTGCVAVLRSVFREKHRTIPTGALLKALIVHGAVDLFGTKFAVVSRYEGQKNTFQKKWVKMTRAPNPFQGFGRVDINRSLYPILENPITRQRGFVDGALGSGVLQKVATIDVPAGAKSLTVTLAYTDKAGADLQNIISLEVKAANGSRFHPLDCSDPLDRKDLRWSPSNVAKVVEDNPPQGPGEILLTVETSDPIAKFAIVWTIISV